MTINKNVESVNLFVRQPVRMELRRDSRNTVHSIHVHSLTYFNGYVEESGSNVPCPPKRKIAGEMPGVSDELNDPPIKRNRSTGISTHITHVYSNSE